MGNQNERKHTMDAGDFFAWQSQTIPAEPFMGDDDLAEDVDEPPDHHSVPIHLQCPAFQKSLIRPQGLRTESLLTRQFTQSTVPPPSDKPQIRIATDLTRRRSCMSIASAASTSDLTSDGGGITSPARTSTPSPPYHGFYMGLIPTHTTTKQTSSVSFCVNKDIPDGGPTTITQIDPPVVAATEAGTAPPPRKRCISFACAPAKPPVTIEVSPTKVVSEDIVDTPKQEPKRSISFACGVPRGQPTQISTSTQPTTESKVQLSRPEPTKRSTTIKFDCPSKPVVATNTRVESIDIVSKAQSSPSAEVTPTNPVNITSPKKIRGHSRSPSWTRKIRPTPPTPKQRDIAPTNATKNTHKPTYVAVSETDSMSSEANRFHVFASDEHQEDDWITNDKSDLKKRLTINDTLKKENVIRRLGEEVEAEVNEEDEEDDDVDEEEEEEDDDEEDEIEDNDEDIDDEEGSDQDIEDDLENDSAAVSEFKGIFSDHDGSASTDGNESDNELGFGAGEEADDSGDEDYDFWTPGRRLHISSSDHRRGTHRSASDSSIDSLRHMSPVNHKKTIGSQRTKTRKIKIRPGTPDLPDSTDFVCGTLDEDRPAESAYVSCMEQRRHEKRNMIPQDIDPSFPTSDPEDLDEEDDDDVDEYGGSEPETWIGQGKFEESDDDKQKHRPYARRSPNLSPKRLHSPPPPAHRRLRSPAPIRRLHSPPPPKTMKVRSPPAPKHHSPPPKPRTQTSKRLSSPPPMKRFHSPPPPSSRATNNTTTQSRGLFDGRTREEGAASKQIITADYSTQQMKSPPGSLVQPLHIAQAATPFGGSRPGLSITKSLPRTPSAFCRQYRESRLRTANEPMTSDNKDDGHTRGAIDIKRGLQQKNERRAEKLHRIHCNRARKAKDCEKKLVPGRGAERMRQRGLQNAGKWDPTHMGHVPIQHPKEAQYVLSV